MARHSRRRALLAAVFILALSACGESGLGPDFDPQVEAFIEVMNAHRESIDCPALVWNRDVAEVAQAHSVDMLQRDFFAHENPDGLSPFDRLGAAGIEYSRAAENIAWGYPSAEAVLEGWLNSSGHRRNIENCALTEHGVGLIETRWTHLFVTP